MAEFHNKIIREELRYEADTGLLWWTTSKGDRQLTKPVGSLMDSGYLQVKIAGTYFPAHRICWFLYHGKWPIRIRHIDRNSVNNKIENLHNVSVRNDFVSKNLNIYQRENGNYSVRLRHNGIRSNLGTYASLNEAKTARDAKLKEWELEDA